MSWNMLEIFTIAVLVGVVGQILASATRLPAIIFLLLLGVSIGPEGTNLIQPAELGELLPLLTKAFVAIILFEGALTLDPKLLRESLLPVWRLILAGGLITMLGAAALAHWVCGLSWPMSFLFGSLVIVTGPTVIAPILRRVTLTPRLHAVLKSESILIDPFGVLAVAVTLEYALAGKTDMNWGEASLGVLYRLALGTAIGVSLGVVFSWVSRLPMFRKAGNEHLVSLAGLGLALGCFCLCERLLVGTGIPGVIAAGLTLAYLPVPFRNELERFKDLLTILGVSVLFVLLSANLNLDVIQLTGTKELIFLFGLIFLVRPLGVWAATSRTSLNVRERAYLSLIAPRGILAAAMASHAAEQLHRTGATNAGMELEGLVFLTIGVTVLLQGGWAGPLATLLGVRRQQPSGIILVGINDWSLAVAEAVRQQEQPVLFLDDNPDHAGPVRQLGFEVLVANATNPTTYDQIDLSRFGSLLAMTPNDGVNALACVTAATRLGEHAVYRVRSRPMPSSAHENAFRPGSGRWAMPTSLAHRQVCRLLRERKLGRAVVDEWPKDSVQEDDSRAFPVPMLIGNHGKLRVAAQGDKVDPDTFLIVLEFSNPENGSETGDSAWELTPMNSGPPSTIARPE